MTPSKRVSQEAIRCRCGSRSRSGRTAFGFYVLPRLPHATDRDPPPGRIPASRSPMAPLRRALADHSSNGRVGRHVLLRSSRTQMAAGHASFEGSRYSCKPASRSAGIAVSRERGCEESRCGLHGNKEDGGGRPAGGAGVEQPTRGRSTQEPANPHHLIQLRISCLVPARSETRNAARAARAIPEPGGHSPVPAPPTAARPETVVRIVASVTASPAGAARPPAACGAWSAHR